jgi:hypothetical protein
MDRRSAGRRRGRGAGGRAGGGGAGCRCAEAHQGAGRQAARYALGRRSLGDADADGPAVAREGRAEGILLLQPWSNDKWVSVRASPPSYGVLVLEVLTPARCSME